MIWWGVAWSETALRSSHSDGRSDAALWNPACQNLCHCTWACHTPGCHLAAVKTDETGGPAHDAHGWHGTRHAPPADCSSERPHKKHLRSCLQTASLACQKIP